MEDNLLPPPPSDESALPPPPSESVTFKKKSTDSDVSTSESVSGGLGGINPSMDNLRPTPKRENDRVKGDVISKSTISLFQNNPAFKIEEPVIEKEILAPTPTINDINNPNYAKQAEDRAAIEARKNAINAKNEKALANRERYFQELEKKGVSKQGIGAIKEDIAKNEVSNALYKQAGKVVQNNPDNKQATFELAVAAQNTGRYGDALNLFTKVLSMKGDSGQSGFVQSGGLESRTELPSSDNPANSLVGLGNVMYHTGDMKGALDYYKQALDVDPTNYLAQSGINLIEAKKGGKGIPFLSPQQVQDKIDAEKQRLEAPAKQQESDKKAEQEQNKRSQYIGDVANSIEALAGVSEDEKGKVIGWLLNPIASAGVAANRAAQGMAKKGIEEIGSAVDEALHYDYSPKDISKTYGKKGEILDTEQEGQNQGFLHIPVKALAGAAHLAFAASPEFAKFMGATEGIKTIASQNENTKWVGDAVDMPFEVATKALNAVGIKPEEGSVGSYLEEAANLVIGGAILHSGGKIGKSIKDFADFKEASKLAAEDKLTPAQKLEYDNYLKILNTVNLDDIAMVAKKSKTPESKVILEKINEVKNFDAEKTQAEVDNLKKDIEAETDNDIKAQLQEKLSGLEQQLVSHTEKQAETLAHNISGAIQSEELQAQLVDLEKKKEESNSETAKATIQGKIDEIKLQLSNLPKQVEVTIPVKVEGVREGAEVKEPSDEQKLQDIQNGDVVTFTYKSKSEIPVVLKDRVSSSGTINGVETFRVTLSKSEADYLLAQEVKPKSGSAGAGGDVAKPTFENVPILTRTAEEIEFAKNEVFDNLNKLEVGSVIENSDGEIKVVVEKSTDKKGNQLIGVVSYERQSDGSLIQRTNIVWASKGADGKIKLDYNPHTTGTNSKGERVTVTDQITDKKIDLSKENIFTEDKNGNIIQINKVEQPKAETPKSTEEKVSKLNYKVVEPETHELVELPIADVLASHEKTGFGVKRGESEKSDTRIDNAKKEIENQIEGKSKEPLTATLLNQTKDGEVFIGDGRRRLIALQELGVKNAKFEVPKEQVESIKEKFNGSTEEKVVNVGGTELPQTVGDIIDKTGYYDGKEGSFTQDGQTVIFTEKGGNKEYEIGNIDEIKNNPLSDHKIEAEISEVGTDSEGRIVVNGKVYENHYSNPLSAINYNKDGSIKSVDLVNKKGRKSIFTGKVAEDLAYQIHLKLLDKHIKDETITKQQADQFLESEPSEERTATIEAIESEASNLSGKTDEELINLESKVDQAIEGGESKDGEGSNEANNKVNDGVNKGVNEGVKIFEELDKLAEEPTSADRKKIKEIYDSNPKIAEINRNFKNIIKQLEEQGKITKKCP